MLSNALEQTINQAHREARAGKCEYLTTEHLLLALLDNELARATLLACEADIERLRTDLLETIEREVPKIREDSHIDIRTSVGFQRVIQRAIFHGQSAGRKQIEGSHLLVAILSEQETFSAYFLMRQNISKLDILNYVTHGISKNEERESDYDKLDEQSFDSEESVKEEPFVQSALSQFTINLNDKAGKGNIDTLIGRSQEMMRLIQILCRRNKNNPLLIGEAGVGKTAIVEGIALQINLGEIPEEMRECELFQLDLGALVAGTKYRGDFEKRLKLLCKELLEKPHAILFIDEIHSIIGAGATSGGTLDASNLLKPLLSKGRMRVIGATTYQEYQSIFEKNTALARRFQRIDIKEPSVEETIMILKGLKSKFEQYHRIIYTDAALERAVTLSAKFINDRFLPDKALDIIDEAGSHQKIYASALRKKQITPKEIEEVVSQIAKIPLSKLSDSDVRQLANLESYLKTQIFGQDHAISQVVDVIKMSKAGLRDANKPIAVFLLSGPTGVGKTELTLQLSEHLHIPLIRFDMSEYMEKHSIARLIGAPPGYIGFEQAGLLSAAILKTPHAVLLLDEIEKAHPDLLNIMLQVMDNASLTDANGRLVDFRNVIIVMTTNSGARSFQSNPIGFSRSNDVIFDGLKNIEQDFSPEFRNRLDSVIQFNPLIRDYVVDIVDKFIKNLEQQLAGKNVNIDVTIAARAWLADVGFDSKMGARAMARMIQNHLKKPLSDALLFGELVAGGTAYFEIIDCQMQFSCKPLKAAAQTKKKVKIVTNKPISNKITPAEVFEEM